MGIIQFIFLCIVLGLIVWLVNRFLPIPQEIKTIIMVAVIIVLILVLAGAMGLFSLGDMQIPRLR